MTEQTRPRTRADCMRGGSNAERPCPWAGCRHNLGIDVVCDGEGQAPTVIERASVWSGDVPSCSLDVAAGGGETLDAVGEICESERVDIRRIEANALRRLRRLLLAEGDAFALYLQMVRDAPKRQLKGVRATVTE